jgi:predicted 3-demethylubiquinone-9 3-methyltransferase (glyoxalase superfamily)
MSEVSTCLWFGKDAESAVRFYVSIVPGSTIHHIQRSPGAWPGGEAGDVILISFRLGGQSFQALNGGAPVEYGTAVSISVQCADQAEIDRLWAALTADGGAEIMCGSGCAIGGASPGRSCRRSSHAFWPTQIQPFQRASSPQCRAW